MCLFLRPYHAVLITTALWCVLKSGSVVLLALIFFLKIALAGPVLFKHTLCWSCYVSGTVLGALQVLTHSICTRALSGTLTCSILQLWGKPRHREVRKTAQGCIAGEWQNWDLDPGSLALEPVVSALGSAPPITAFNVLVHRLPPSSEAELLVLSSILLSKVRRMNKC